MGYVAMERALLLKVRPVLIPHPRQQPVYLREWTWPILKDYNGFTGAERVRGWQIGFWSRTVGLTTPAQTCDICFYTGSGVAYHSEDYYHTFAALPLCKGCHMQIHKRFKAPDQWRAFVNRYAPRHPPGAWFTQLPLWEIDYAGYLRTRYGDKVSDLFDNPRYQFPAGTPLPKGKLFDVGTVQAMNTGQGLPPARARSRIVQPVALSPPVG